MLCRVAAVKRLPIHHHSAGYDFMCSLFPKAILFDFYNTNLKANYNKTCIMISKGRNFTAFTWLVAITKTCLYNFDPLKPHFYIVKLGFTRVYIIFVISAKNINCVYSLEPPRRGGSNEYPQSMFWAEIWKISEFCIWKFSVFGGEIIYIFE